jgi:hypothetical protein
MAKTSFTVLHPAEIGLPGDVRTVAVIDRSAPRNAGQHILGAMEGAATGEAIGADRGGASQAIDALVEQLVESPRFDVVIPIVNARERDSSLFDTVLDWRTARRIARRVGADAIVSLESFDSDSLVTVDTKKERVERNGRTVTEVSHAATRSTDVHVGWRVYDVERRVLLDDTRDALSTDTWRHRGDTRVEAVGGLPSPQSTVIAVGGTAGSMYGTRIAPHYVVVSRKYFGQGDPQLRAARQLVRADLWDEAANIWRGMLTSESDRVLLAKARHNMAVYHELDGRLGQARVAAQHAAALMDTPATRSYLRDLDARIDDLAQLDRQMAVVD